MADSRRSRLDLNRPARTYSEEQRWLPDDRIHEYALAAVQRAKVEELEEGGLYASVPGLVGVWVTAPTRDELLNELAEVVVEWASIKMMERDGDLPVLAGIDLNR
jgi:hypothetical protein